MSIDEKTDEVEIDEIDHEELRTALHFLPDQLSLVKQELVSPLSNVRPIVFGWEDIGFYVRRRHWDNPSNWHIREDGDWYFFAKRIVNFNKSWADTGPTHSIGVDLEYFDDWDSEHRVVAGTRIHSIRHVLATVEYKQAFHNHSRTGRDIRFAELYADIVSARLSSWWR